MENESSGEQLTVTPIMEWDSQEPWKPGLVWWTRLDKRFQVEVHRGGPEPTLAGDGVVDIDNSSRGGILYIFDHTDANKLLHSEDVGISYGAPFGPDVEDVQSWEARALHFVDEILPNQQT